MWLFWLISKLLLGELLMLKISRALSPRQAIIVVLNKRNNIFFIILIFIFVWSIVKSIKKSKGFTMKMVCFYNFEWEKEYLQKNLLGFEIRFIKGTTAETSVFSDQEAQILCLFIDSPVSKELLKRFPSLKLIATRSTGFNHIDSDAAKKLKISICTVPAYGKHTVAEYTFGLMIIVMRKIYEACSRVRAHDFSREGLCGSDLCGKTLGVIGTGNIGSCVVKLGTAFGMNVCACDMKPNEELVCENGCAYKTLAELLFQSDIVTIHVPYNKGTHHLINEENIMQFKKGSFLINTARGPIVQTSALVKALKEGILAGAGLDVLEEEGAMTHALLGDHSRKESQTIVENNYLIEHPHVIVTSHNAFNSYEARKILLDCTIENIKNFVGGHPTHLVL